MGKLVIDKFESLKGIQNTQYLRIFGLVLEYDAGPGVIYVQSFYDKSICEIELDFESGSFSTVRTGVSVDTLVVTNHYNDKDTLVEISTRVIQAPTILADNEALLKEFVE